MQKTLRSRVDQPDPPDIEHPGIPSPPESPKIDPGRPKEDVELPDEPGIDPPEPSEVDDPDRREAGEEPDPERPGPPAEG